MLVAKEKCYVCGKTTEFTIFDGATLQREAMCNHCGATIRNSDTAKVIVHELIKNDTSLMECKKGLAKFKILEAGSSGVIHQVLHDLSNYTCFEYFPDVEVGKYKDNIQCNDLQSLTYHNNIFDLIISQDVLEHVERPHEVFREIKRVLKDNGCHIFTVPWHENKPTKIRKGLPIVYHGDSLRSEGIIVYTDWGEDICDFIDIYGMKTEVIRIHDFYASDEITDADNSYEEYLNKEPLEYFRYNSPVFISRSINDKSSWLQKVKRYLRI